MTRGTSVVAAFLVAGCAGVPPGRLEWVNLPVLRTQTTVIFDRGNARRTDDGYLIHLVSLAGARERAIVRTVDVNVARNQGPWALRYQIEGPWPTRRYRSVETPVTECFEDEVAHRLRGRVAAKLVETLYRADYDGGTIELRFDVALEP